MLRPIFTQDTTQCISHPFNFHTFLRNQAMKRLAPQLDSHTQTVQECRRRSQPLILNNFKRPLVSPKKYAQNQCHLPQNRATRIKIKEISAVNSLKHAASKAHDLMYFNLLEKQINLYKDTKFERVTFSLSSPVPSPASIRNYLVTQITTKKLQKSKGLAFNTSIQITIIDERLKFSTPTPAS